MADDLLDTSITLTPTGRSGITRHLRLKPGDVIPVGRASRSSTAAAHPTSTNAFFDCPVISRQHAELEANTTPSSGRVTITDLGSMHGTFVNGCRLVKQEPFELKDGDVICLGDNVRRGTECYRGINMKFEHADLSDADFAAGSRSFAVPIESDDESKDDTSQYGSDPDSIFEAAQRRSSSPQTSPIAVHVDGSAQQPINLDEPLSGSFKPVGDLISPVEYAKEYPRYPSLYHQQPAQRSSDQSNVVRDKFLPNPVPQPIISDSWDAEGPELMSTRGELLEDYLGNPQGWSSALPDQAALPTCSAALFVPPEIKQAYESVQPATQSSPTRVERECRNGTSSSKMAIPNIVAPQPPRCIPPPEKCREILEELAPFMEASKKASNDTKEAAAILEETSTNRKRKQSEAELDHIHGDSAQQIQRDVADMMFGLDNAPPMPLSFEMALAQSGFEAKRQCRGLRKPRRQRSSFVRETGKYTFGAVVGAFGTFAFLASPLGGRFADWLATL